MRRSPSRREFHSKDSLLRSASHVVDVTLGSRAYRIGGGGAWGFISIPAGIEIKPHAPPPPIRYAREPSVTSTTWLALRSRESFEWNSRREGERRIPGTCASSHSFTGCWSRDRQRRATSRGH